MTAISPAPALRSELRDLYDDYAATLDAIDLDGWLEFFTEDARYTVTSRENYDAGHALGLIYCDGKAMLRDRTVAIRETTVYEPRTLRHLVSGVRVLETSDAEVRAGANFALFESMSDREPRLALVGRYLDRLVFDGERWRFSERFCIYDNYRVHTSLIVPV